MKTTRYLTAAFATAAVVALSGCGSSGGGSSAPPTQHPSTSTSDSGVSPSPSGGTQSTPSAQPMVITIKNYGYQGPQSVSPGASITVKNDDSVSHTVTADSGGAFDVTVTAAGSATFKAPAKPGSYPYHCTFHSNMHGTLVVK